MALARFATVAKAQAVARMPLERRTATLLAFVRTLEATAQDDVLDLFAFSGTPAQIADQAEALFAAGARRVDFGTPHGLDERAGVESLVREVAPRLGW